MTKWVQNIYIWYLITEGANVDKISSDSLRKKLVAGKEKAYLSLELVHLSDRLRRTPAAHERQVPGAK